MSGDVEEFRRLLGERLSTVASKFRTKLAAAAAAGVTPEQFAKWQAATVKVPAEGLWRLALAAKVDLGWLCAGGDMPDDTALPPGALDAQVMRDVLIAMIDATREGDVVYASPEKFAELAGVLHDYVLDQRQAAAPPDPKMMGKIIRLASSR